MLKEETSVYILYAIYQSIRTFTEIHSLFDNYNRKKLNICIKKMITKNYIHEEHRGVYKLTENGKEQLIKVDSIISFNFKEKVKNFISKQLEYVNEFEKSYQNNDIFRKYFQDNGQLNEDIKAKLHPFNYLYLTQNHHTDKTKKVLWIGIWKKDDGNPLPKFDDDVLLDELSTNIIDC